MIGVVVENETGVIVQNQSFFENDTIYSSM